MATLRVETSNRPRDRGKSTERPGPHEGRRGRSNLRTPTRPRVPSRRNIVTTSWRIFPRWRCSPSRRATRAVSPSRRSTSRNNGAPHEKKSNRRRNPPAPGADGSLKTSSTCGPISSSSGSRLNPSQLTEFYPIMGPDGTPFVRYPG